MTLFCINGTLHDLEANGRTLLEILRDDLGLTGAKKGCGEGECGSCTVHVDGCAVCACIVLGSTVAGKHVETIEAVSKSRLGRDLIGTLAREGAVQCGFCTPGIVMAAAEHFGRDASTTQLDASLEGNLCRCTGYTKVRSALKDIRHQPQPARARRPGISREAAIAELNAQPDLVPIAGGTDLMIKHEGKIRSYEYFDLKRIDDATMTSILLDANSVSIGGLVSWSEIEEDTFLSHGFPILGSVAREIGGKQVRNAGTIGGNIATASPASDSLPALYALQASIEVAGPTGMRSIPVREFVLDRGRTALKSGELIASIRIPTPAARTQQIFRKIGPRRAQSIAKLSLALLVHAEDGRILDIQLAFGAVGSIPMSCPGTRALLLAAPLSDIRYSHFEQTLQSEIAPIDDFRSTKDYRLQVAPRLLWHELSQVCENE